LHRYMCIHIMGMSNALVKPVTREEFLREQPTYWVKRAHQSIRRHVEAELRPYGLTLPQRDTLLALHHDGPLGQSELMEHLGLEQSSVSRLVDGLVRRNLIASSVSDHDRRRRIFTITAEGVARLQATPGSSELAGTRIRSILDATEVAQLISLLSRCIVAFDESETKSTISRRL
jgi:DNA-binding MarR family transcriptional regulator